MTAILPIIAQLLSFLFRVFGVSVEERRAFLDAIEKLPPPQRANEARNDAIKEAEEKWRRDSANTNGPAGK